ncbi:hypothetical protein VTK56DRAFT_1724 [Thermocarpiscus australiensis]
MLWSRVLPGDSDNPTDESKTENVNNYLTPPDVGCLGRFSPLYYDERRCSGPVTLEQAATSYFCCMSSTLAFLLTPLCTMLEQTLVPVFRDQDY